MRFSKYIIEEKSTLQIVMNMKETDIKQFAEDCKIFLTKYKTNISPMYRGIEKNRQPWIKRKSRISDRIPMTTLEELHNLWNNAFEDRFGWKVRNGVFATGDYNLADDYSGAYGPHYFFPCGTFQYVWSPNISDLYVKHGGILREYGDNEAILESQIEKIVKLYKNTSLEDAISSKNEISFNCKEYYLIHAPLMGWNNIIKELLNEI